MPKHLFASNNVMIFYVRENCRLYEKSYITVAVSSSYEFGTILRTGFDQTKDFLELIFIYLRAVLGVGIEWVTDDAFLSSLY